MSMHEDEGRWGSVSEAAQVFGISADTIRRRIKRGELEARREQTPQGFKWLVLLPDTIEQAPLEPAHDAPGSPQSADTAAPGVQIVERDREELVETLRQELALRNREIARLHEVIASQAKAIEVTTAALPATVPTPKGEQPSEVLGSPRGDDQGMQGYWDRLRRWVTGRDK